MKKIEAKRVRFRYGGGHRFYFLFYLLSIFRIKTQAEQNMQIFGVKITKVKSRCVKSCCIKNRYF